MIPRPPQCDDDRCDYTETGVWQHHAQCPTQGPWGPEDVAAATAREDGYSLPRGGVMTATAYLRCPAGACTHRETYDPADHTPDPAVPASADLAYDALVEHMVVLHDVPRGEAGALASQARRFVEPSSEAVAAFREAQVRDGRWTA